jgi:hypothetical protein
MPRRVRIGARQITQIRQVSSLVPGKAANRNLCNLRILSLSAFASVLLTRWLGLVCLPTKSPTRMGLRSDFRENELRLPWLMGAHYPPSVPTSFLSTVTFTH